jgi:hypothetical protein
VINGNERQRFGRLGDQQLLDQIVRLVANKRALEAHIIDHLAEIDRRGLALRRGFSSLFDYVVRELGYTAAAAWRRIKAMRLSTEISVASELLRDGSLNVSNAAQLQNLFERSDRNRERQPRGHRTGGGPGEIPRNDGTAIGPAQAAPVGGPVLDAAAREKLVKQAVGKSTREVQQMLAEVDPELAQPSDRMRALGSGRWELKASIDAECRHGLEKLQMLLSHSDPHLTLGGLVARLVRDGLDRYDPERPRIARHSGGGGTVNRARPAGPPGQRGMGPMQRSVARAKQGAAGRRSEIAPGAPLVAGRDSTPRPSAPKRHTEAEHGCAKSAMVQNIVRRRASAPKRLLVAELGSRSPTTAPNRGGHTDSAPKRHGHIGLGRTLHAAVREAGGCADSGWSRTRLPWKRRSGGYTAKSATTHRR